MFFVGFSLGVTFLSIVRDVQRFSYHRAFVRGIREPRALLAGLGAAGLTVGLSASDLNWTVAPLAALAFVGVLIWVSGREDAVSRGSGG